MSDTARLTRQEMVLLSPGPVPIPDFVMQAMTQPVIHHRTAEFEALYAKILAGFRYLFQTEQHVALAIGSGTYGVEMAMYSLFQPGDKVLVVDMGKFSGRWAAYGQLSGFDVVALVKEWGEHPSVEAIMETLAPHPATKGIVLTHSETSTGAMLDLEEIAFAVKQQYPEMLLLVDAITSVGAMPFYVDAWQIDFAIIASQKALMNPAGTVAFAVSQLAMDKMRDAHPDDFGHLGHYVRQAIDHRFPYTAPVQLCYGLEAALAYIQEKTLPLIWQETHESAAVFRQGLDKIGGKQLPSLPSAALTAFHIPNLPAAPLLRKLEKSGYYLSGGQAHLKESLLRVSHMGMSNKDVMQDLLKVLEEVVPQH